MNSRFLVLLAVATLIIGIALPAATQTTKPAPPSAAKPAAAKAWTVPRTPDGQPDLQGYWTNNTAIDFERPDGVTKEFYTPEEMPEVARRRDERLEERTTIAHYDHQQFGLSKRSTLQTAALRTSIVVDPPNGKVPPVNEEGRRRAAGRAAQRISQDVQYDKVQNVPLMARCLVMGGATPPMLPPPYNPAYQILQNSGYVTILIENLHEVRVIPLDGRPHAPANIRSWLGDSRGHWEGDTLVVETTNFNDQVAFRGASENVKVIERFTRVSDDAITYDFTIQDPSTWDTAWKGELPFAKIDGPIFEHACHEGNYGVANTLSAVRSVEKRATEEAAKKGTK